MSKFKNLGDKETGKVLEIIITKFKRILKNQ